MTSTADPAGWVVLARVRRPWGRRGDLLLQLHTDWPEQRFARGRSLLFRWDDGRERRATVLEFRTLGSGPMLALENVTGISEARLFAGAWIMAPREALERLEGEEWWAADLPGLMAVDPVGQRIGVVEELVEGAAGDWVRVAREGAPDALVPLAFCRELDRLQGRLVIDPPAGLLDERTATEADEERRARESNGPRRS